MVKKEKAWVLPAIICLLLHRMASLGEMGELQKREGNNSFTHCNLTPSPKELK